MKLSPNVTDITEMARAAEAGGADAVSLINTLTGMKIDVNRRTFVLANKTGGMSGPAIKPIAVRMVYRVAQAVNPDHRHGRESQQRRMRWNSSWPVPRLSLWERRISLIRMATEKSWMALRLIWMSRRIGDIRELIGAVK